MRESTAYDERMVEAIRRIRGRAEFNATLLIQSITSAMLYLGVNWASSDSMLDGW